MANIKVTSQCTVYDGMPLTFQAPCDCTEVEGLTVYGPDGTTSQTFTFRDAQVNDLTGVEGLFSSGAYVRVLLDTTNSYAYIQNAAGQDSLDKGHIQSGSLDDLTAPGWYWYDSDAYDISGSPFDGNTNGAVQVTNHANGEVVTQRYQTGTGASKTRIKVGSSSAWGAWGYDSTTVTTTTITPTVGTATMELKKCGNICTLTWEAVTTLPAANTIYDIAVIPAGYRPSYPVYVRAAVFSSGAPTSVAANIWVRRDGMVRITSSTASNMEYDFCAVWIVD